MKIGKISFCYTHTVHCMAVHKYVDNETATNVEFKKKKREEGENRERRDTIYMSICEYIQRKRTEKKIFDRKKEST